jgi:hypothetical protein
MNKERRAELQKAADLLSEAKDLIQLASEDERDYYDNMPEALQGGDKGTRADEVASELEDIASEIDDLMNRVSDAQD